MRHRVAVLLPRPRVGALGLDVLLVGAVDGGGQLRELRLHPLLGLVPLLLVLHEELRRLAGPHQARLELLGEIVGGLVQLVHDLREPAVGLAHGSEVNRYKIFSHCALRTRTWLERGSDYRLMLAATWLTLLCAL